jgi:hypothetical protein
MGFEGYNKNVNCFTFLLTQALEEIYSLRRGRCCISGEEELYPLRHNKKLNQKIMTTYKHTQIGYLMLIVTLAVLVLFAWAQITARAEPPSVDSGTNFLVTFIMALILFVLASVTTLTTSIDEKYLQIKFGYGIFGKKVLLSEIVSAKQVKNHWYYGWGIRFWFWPRMCIYNVSGFDAVEITMKNGKVYRIGTDVPKELETAIKQSINS